MHVVERRPGSRGFHLTRGDAHRRRHGGERHGIPTPRSSIDAAASDVRARPAVAAAIIDTATRADVAPAEVVIAAWSPVTWDDGSTGCPQKGRAYTQTLVEGEVLLLRGGTGLYQYHAAGDGPFAYCANPSSAYSVTADG